MKTTAAVYFFAGIFGQDYSQRIDVVGTNPRHVGAPDADNGLFGATACRRTPDLPQMRRLTQTRE